MSDDQIFASFKSVNGTRQYFYNMLLDVLGKSRQFGVYTLFLSCSAAEFNWTDITKIVAHRCGETLSDIKVQTTHWSTKVTEK